MSWMPNVGTVVRMRDGRTAIVRDFTPLGDDDRVLFEDGHEERISVYDIVEMLTEEPEGNATPTDLLAALRTFLERNH